MHNVARSHVAQVLLPAYSAFMEHYALREFGLRKDTNNGARVAEALRDFPEHIFEDPDFRPHLGAVESARKYRESVCRMHPYYRITCDFADAWKHHRLTKAGRTIDSLKAVREHCALVRYHDAQGVFWDARPMVLVRCLDGSEVELGPLIQSAMDTWLLEAVRLGIIPQVPARPGVRSPLVSRAEARAAVKMLGQEAEYLEAHLIALEFNVKSNCFSRLQSIGEIPGLLEVTTDIALGIFE